MATFKVHLYAGLSLSGAAATSVMLAGVAPPERVPLYFALGAIGSLLPDVDTDKSALVRGAFTLGSILLAFLVMFSLAGVYPSVAELLLVWVGSFLVFRWILFFLFNRFTVHRGLLHSVPAALLSAVVTATGCHRLLGLPALDAWLSGLFLGFGYLVHLLLDELYSVNLFGARHKRSLGTALRFFRRDNAAGSLLLYLSLGAALLMAPAMDGLTRLAADPGIYSTLLSRLAPESEWFARRGGHGTPGQRLTPASGASSEYSLAFVSDGSFRDGKARLDRPGGDSTGAPTSERDVSTCADGGVNGIFSLFGDWCRQTFPARL